MKYMRYDEKDADGNVVDTKFSFFCKVARSRGGYKITLPRSILKEGVIKCNESWNVRICSVDSERDSKDYSFNSRHPSDISFTSTIRMPSTVAPYITVPRESCRGICSYIPSGNHRPWCQIVMSKRDKMPLITPIINNPINIQEYDSISAGWVPFDGFDSDGFMSCYISFDVAPTVINNRIFFKLPSEYFKWSYCIQFFGSTCWSMDIYDRSGKLVYGGHTYPARIGEHCYAFFKDYKDDVVQKKPLDYVWKIVFRCIGYF